MPGEGNEFGMRYRVDFQIFHNNREARVRSTWIVLHGELAPRLTSCFVLLD